VVSSDEDRCSSELLPSSSYESPAVFEDFDFDLPLRWYHRAWSIVLCFAGVLDILAYLEPTLRGPSEDRCGRTADASSAAAPPSTWWWCCCSTWITFLNNLREYNVVIAFVFSLLWFRHSLIKAREEHYQKFVVHKDRVGETTIPATKTAFSAEHYYYRRLLTKMLLLPMGFYIILFHLLRGLLRGKLLYRELLIKPANETVFLTLQDPNEYVTIEMSEAHAKMSTAFAIFVYLKHHLRLATRLARASFENSAIPKVKRQLVFNAARNPMSFVRQLKLVFKYVRWIKYTLPLVLKLKKLRANTLSTLRKRRQYRIATIRRMFQTIKQRRNSSSPRFGTEEDAAVLIQRVWRAHRKYLYQRVAIHFVREKKLSAALKIQVAYRRRSFRAKIQATRRRKRELVRLERLRRQTSRELDDDQRRRLYELQDEFVAEAKKTINQRLLVRPNTRRAVAWNSVFLVCILVEISHDAFRPWLAVPKAKAKRTDDQRYRSLRWLLAESLVPDPVAETPACKDLFRRPSALQRLFYRRHHVERPTRREVVSAFLEEITDPDHGLEGTDNATRASDAAVPWRCSEPISTWRDGYRDLVALAFRPTPVWEWPACRRGKSSRFDRVLALVRKPKKKAPPPRPWYCGEPYATVHNGYRSAWNFLIDQIQEVLSFIGFCDVFVKFFTGELDPVTHELRPKPLFRRWIFPGLLLQLLVNPAIERFSIGCFRVVDLVMTVGPVRVLRWCIAVAVPAAYGLRNLAAGVLREADCADDATLALCATVVLRMYGS